MTRTVLVTGASAGIGEAFAEVFAAAGWHLVITARRRDWLDALAARLEAAHRVRVHVLVADLAEAGAPARICDELAARQLTIDGLVNNAGYGVPGPFTGTSWERHGAFLTVMVIAVTELTRRLVPGMVERRFGRVINVASLAGLVPAPAGHTLYAASKAFLIKFSEALAAEVAPHGVHVTAVCPGFTVSEFHDVTGTRAKVSTLPSFMWMTAPEVAQAGYAAVEAGIPIFVPGRANRLIALLVRLVPQSLVRMVNNRAARQYRTAHTR